MFENENSLISFTANNMDYLSCGVVFFI